MEENTLFQEKPQEGGAPQSPPHGQPTQPSGQPPASQQPSFQSFGGFPPHHEDEDHPSLLGRILKILLLILFIGGIAFGIYQFVLPQFFSQKKTTTTLTYWGLWESESVMQQAIEEFEREHPNTKVKYVKQDVKQYRDRLMTRIPNGNGPDVFRYHNTWLPMMRSYLSPLPEGVIGKEAFQKAYYPVVQKDVVQNGAIYGIPLQMDTLALYTNKDIFTAGGVSVPKTWDEFDDVTRTLTVKDEQGKIKTAGAAIGTYDNIAHAPDIISLLLLQNGANLRDLTSTLENASDALSFYTSFAKGEGNVWDETLDNSLVMFARGNVGMYFGYSWDVFAIKQANPTLAFEVHPVPHIPGREVTVASYWVEGVSIKSKHQKEAMEFMKFLARKETQQKLFAEAAKTRPFGELYAHVELGDTLKTNTLAYPFIKQAKTATSSFFVSDTFDNGLNTDMNTYLGNAVRSVLSNTSAQSAVETLAKGVAQILNQYGQ